MRTASWLEERYYIIHPSFGVFFRNQKMQRGKLHTDCIPRFWLYIYNDFRGEIAFIRKGNEVQLWGPTVIFIPPFSIINWKFLANQLDWFAYQGTIDLEGSLPLEPIYFSSNVIEATKEETLFLHLRKHRQLWRSMGAQNHLSSVATKTKRYIDNRFNQDLKVAHIAKDLNYSPDVMTRQFKRMYGVTPSQYSRDLKYYQAALQITESSRTLKNIAKNVGVDNYENFSKVFRLLFSTRPKNFRIKK